jgi:hypothetical protein
MDGILGAELLASSGIECTDSSVIRTMILVCLVFFGNAKTPRFLLSEIDRFLQVVTESLLATCMK